MAYRPQEYAQRYRNRAEELRAIAENTETDAARRTYLQLAAEYDALAAKADADARAAAAEAGEVGLLPKNRPSEPRGGDLKRNPQVIERTPIRSEHPYSSSPGQTRRSPEPPQMAGSCPAMTTCAEGDSIWTDAAPNIPIPKFRWTGSFVVPAQAGTHASAARSSERWMPAGVHSRTGLRPASAGMTITAVGCI